MSETEVCLKISGRVQRVGFRRWAVSQAQNIGGIDGYVCNINDGSVLIYMRADEEKMLQYIQKIYQGPFLARVDQVENMPQNKKLFPPIESGVFKKI